MKTTKRRNPNEEHINQQLADESLKVTDGNWEVNKIHAQKLQKGETYYLIEWKGYKEFSWVSADELNADEILEDWEIENSANDE